MAPGSSRPVGATCWAVVDGKETTMSQLSVRLFGRLAVRCDEQVVHGLNASKVQELLCYLLLHRDRPHPREALASLLWGDTSTAQSKKYLRQCLWQLQAALNFQQAPPDRRLLRVESEWVQLSSASGLRLDVAVFEAAFAAVQHVQIHDLDAPCINISKKMLTLYDQNMFIMCLYACLLLRSCLCHNFFLVLFLLNA